MEQLCRAPFRALNEHTINCATYLHLQFRGNSKCDVYALLKLETGNVNVYCLSATDAWPMRGRCALDVGAMVWQRLLDALSMHVRCVGVVGSMLGSC